MLKNTKRIIKDYIGSKILKLAFLFKDKYCAGLEMKRDEDLVVLIKIKIFHKLYEIGCRFYL